MRKPAEMFQYEFLSEHDILIGRFLVDSLEKKEDAKEVYEFAISELEKQPDAADFILDVTSINHVSSYAIGTLMKSLQYMKKSRGYMILLMKETLLWEIMIEHPVMFDYYAVFHNIDDAIAFIKK